MLKLYTCYTCGFPFKADDGNLPPECPACGAGMENYLAEPYNEREIRRIHVDPPLPDPNWDPMNLEWHMPKQFPPRSRNGRVRRFVLEYEDPAQLQSFYSDVFGWDIIPTEHADSAMPLLYCATGPGTLNWEPRVVSFTYGYLRPRSMEETGSHPMYVIEVTDIDKTIALVQQNGGKLLKSRYEEEGNQYAIVEDSEGNGLYLWQTPDSVTWLEPESKS